MKAPLKLILWELRAHYRQMILLILLATVAVTSDGLSLRMESGLTQALSHQTRLQLGADLVLRSGVELPPQLGARLKSQPGVKAVTQSFSTFVMLGPPSAQTQSNPVAPQLVEVRTVDAAFPLIPNLVQAEPPGAWDQLPHGVIIDEALAQVWHVQLNDPLDFAGHEVKVVGFLKKDLLRSPSLSFLGGRVYLWEQTARSWGIIQSTARLQHQIFMSVERNLQDDLKPLQARLQVIMDGDSQVPQPVRGQIRILTHAEAQQGLKQVIENVLFLLRLTVSLVFVVASLGCAVGFLSFLRTLSMPFLTLRTMGLSSAQLLCVLAGILGVVWLSAIGISAVFVGLFPLPKSLFGIELSPASSWILSTKSLNEFTTNFFNISTLRVLLLFFIVACGVAPLVIRVTRSHVGALFRDPLSLSSLHKSPADRVCLFMMVLLEACVVAAAAPSSAQRTSWLAVWGVCALGVTLIWVLLRFVVLKAMTRWGNTHRNIPWVLRLGLWQGGAYLKTQMFSLVVMCSALAALTLLWGLQGAVVRGLKSGQNGLRTDFFVIDIPEADFQRFQRFCTDSAMECSLAPLVKARITHVNGTPMAKRSYVPNPADSLGGNDRDTSASDMNRGNEFRTREQNISFSMNVPFQNQIVAGEFWSPRGAVSEPYPVSLEERFAQRLQISLGDVLRFYSSGLEWDLKVTSMRSVPWQNLQPNFFLIAHPHAFNGVPRLGFAAMRLTKAEGRLQATLALRQAFPSLSVIDVKNLGESLEKTSSTLVHLVLGFFFALFVSSALMAILRVFSERRHLIREQKLMHQMGIGATCLRRIRAVQRLSTWGASALAGMALGWGAGLFLLRYFWGWKELPAWDWPVLALALGLLAIFSGELRMLKPTSKP